jgi:hypothetical protein
LSKPCHQRCIAQYLTSVFDTTQPHFSIKHEKQQLNSALPRSQQEAAFSKHFQHLVCCLNVPGFIQLSASHIKAAMAAAAGLGPLAGAVLAASVIAGGYKHPYLCAANFSGVSPKLTIGYWCHFEQKYRTILPEYTIERMETEKLDEFLQQNRIVEGVDKYHIIASRGESAAISKQKCEARVEVAEIIIQRTLNYNMTGDPDHYPTSDDESQESEPAEESQETAEEEESLQNATQSQEGNVNQGTAVGYQKTTPVTAPLAAADEEQGGSGLVPNAATERMQAEVSTLLVTFCSLLTSISIIHQCTQ